MFSHVTLKVRRNQLLSWLSLTLVANSSLALSSPFTNIPELARQLNFETYRQQTSVRPIKVAIFDNGFRGHAAQLGKTLPGTTQFHAGPVAINGQEEMHGLRMAQIIVGLLEQTPNIQYELHLFQTAGYTNLEKAVQSAIERKIDVILHANVWHYGGNGDGQGFINAVVNRATSAGITWINAVGNLGNASYISWVKKSNDNWAQLPDANDSLAIRCEKNPRGKCPVRIVLSWNSYKDVITEGTDKDLDLVLSDDTLKIIASSQLTQTYGAANSQQGTSNFPREIIETEIKPGLYYIRAKIRSENFSADRDQMRFVVRGDSLKLFNSTPGESVFPPADNPTVITVGALDDTASSFSESNNKPELLSVSRILIPSQKNPGKTNIIAGSSTASAITTAAAVVLKSQRPDVTRNQLISALASGQAAQVIDMGLGALGQGLPLELLQFTSTTPTGMSPSMPLGCFAPAVLPVIPTSLQPFLRAGAMPVITTAGIKIFAATDPFTHFAGLRRHRADDMLVFSTQGIQLLPRAEQWKLNSRGEFEVLQTPKNQTLCGSQTAAQRAKPNNRRAVSLPPHF